MPDEHCIMTNPGERHMSIRDDIINEILDVEGKDFTDDPADSGGATKWGVTERVARYWGYTGQMKYLPRASAFKILVGEYWTPIKGDALEALSSMIAREVGDTAVNCGVHRAAILLQRCLNVLNREGMLYPDLKADGRIGPATLGALRAYLSCRSEVTLHKALNCLQGAHYITLAESRAVCVRVAG